LRREGGEREKGGKREGGRREKGGRKEELIVDLLSCFA